MADVGGQVRLSAQYGAPDVVATARLLMGALLGTLGALAIGLSDLFGRRIVLASTPLTAAVTLQLSGGLISAATVAVIPSEWLWPDVNRGLISGLGMGVGLSCYYTGLVRSTSTIVAPLVATLSAVLPFSYVLLAIVLTGIAGVVAA